MSDRIEIEWSVTPETLRELADDISTGGKPIVWIDDVIEMTLKHGEVT